MNNRIHFYAAVVLSILWTPLLWAQVENVRIDHPVYVFLKRMEVRGIIEQYNDAVLPLSRKEIAGFLQTVQRKTDRLTGAERGWLDDFLSEFQFDISGSLQGFNSVINQDQSGVTSGFREFFAEREKFLYAYSDSNLSFFANGLLNFDIRRITGDALGNKHSEYIQFGGKFRGTIYGKLGYYFEGTNAQFWGSRELLLRDPIIEQTHTVRVQDAQNFDMSEGYVRYDGEVVSAQVGIERLLWGNSYHEQLVLSQNPRPFPFIRGDLKYKALKYTFMHGWLIGTQGSIQFSLPADTSTKVYEPVAADKYIAAHRLEFSFPGLFDIGIQEMMIYSNRSVDLAYLTPIIVLESAQRARGERDNGLWAFDIQTHFTAGLEIHGTILFDDLHLSDFFKPRFYNKNAYQAGIFLADPLFVPNMSFMVEWTRIEPFVFAHDRSRDNNFATLGKILGASIGPNSELWFFRLDYLPLRNLSVSVRVTLVRHGDNVFDSQGNLVKNVGGSIDIGHRDIDPIDRVFLDGILIKTKRAQLFATYEVVNQIWLDGWYQYESAQNVALATSEKNHTYGTRLRLVL
ncbi:MAG: hypothetical protein HY708_02610 [Ignavibacteriae bacterium]|nr:hypothetical protein [Ignavibacteriota bacterium]